MTPDHALNATAPTVQRMKRAITVWEPWLGNFFHACVEALSSFLLAFDAINADPDMAIIAVGNATRVGLAQCFVHSGFSPLQLHGSAHVQTEDGIIMLDRQPGHTNIMPHPLLLDRLRRHMCHVIGFVPPAMLRDSMQASDAALKDAEVGANVGIPFLTPVSDPWLDERDGIVFPQASELSDHCALAYDLAMDANMFADSREKEDFLFELRVRLEALAGRTQWTSSSALRCPRPRIGIRHIRTLHEFNATLFNIPENNVAERARVALVIGEGPIQINVFSGIHGRGNRAFNIDKYVRRPLWRALVGEDETLAMPDDPLKTEFLHRARVVIHAAEFVGDDMGFQAATWLGANIAVGAMGSHQSMSMCMAPGNDLIVSAMRASMDA
jgi:hypothetical protein